jgi:integrase
VPGLHVGAADGSLRAAAGSALRPKRFSSTATHPVTGARFRLRARTARELAAQVDAIERLRADLRLGLRSPGEIDRQLRRLRYGSIVLERAVRTYAEREDLTAQTRRHAMSFLRGLGALAGRELDALDAPAVGAWIDRARRRGAAESTLQAQWWILRAVVRYALERGWIGQSPWGSWRPVFRGAGGVGSARREAARSPGELVRILAAARLVDDERMRTRPALPPDGEPKIAAAATLGLRQGELAGLRWSDFDEAHLTVTIARQYAGALPKGKAPKRLRALPELFALLARHRGELEARGLYAPAGPVFPSPTDSAPGSPRAYSKGQCLSTRYLRTVVARAGLPNVQAWSPHSLRDSFVTLESAAHTDLSALAERTRHASLASLLRYLRSRSREPAPPGFSLGDGAVAPALGPAPEPTKRLPPAGEPPAAEKARSQWPSTPK